MSSRSRVRRNRANPASARLERALQGLLLAVVMGSALAFGSVHGPTILIIAALTAVATMLALLFLSMPLDRQV